MKDRQGLIAVAIILAIAFISSILIETAIIGPEKLFITVITLVVVVGIYLILKNI